MFLLWIWPTKRLSGIEKEGCTTLIGNILRKVFQKTKVVNSGNKCYHCVLFSFVCFFQTPNSVRKKSIRERIEQLHKECIEWEDRLEKSKDKFKQLQNGAEQPHDKNDG